jgi:acyl CoA:acetate/3-ketoacid CoA transferase
MRRVTVDDAVKVIRSGDTILVGGSGGDHAVPEAPMAAVERRFPAEGAPSACFTSTSARERVRREPPHRRPNCGPVAHPQFLAIEPFTPL